MLNFINLIKNLFIWTKLKTHKRKHRLNPNSHMFDLDYWCSVRCARQKKRAKIRNVEFNLIPSDCKKLFLTKKCFYCKKEFKYPIKIGDMTFDRVDPLKGYHKDNVVLCCTRCNNIKSVQDSFIVQNFKKSNPGFRK